MHIATAQDVRGSIGGPQQPLVSVVTPVYNAAPYLRECIESVISQTYQHWEYIIVDNCSTDASLQIAEAYASRYPQIKLIRNRATLRAIANHNFALTNISNESKYCKMLFADDWIFPECIDKMVGLAERHSSVGIVGAYSLEGTEVKRTGLPYLVAVVPGREICREQLIGGLHVFGSPNCLLYRSDLVRARNSFYNEANIHADTEVCFDLLRSCDFGFVHQVLTFTRVRQGCLSAATAGFGSWFANVLSILVRYGSDFLSPEESAEFLTRHLARYYRFLGKSLVLGYGRDFWTWHRQKFAEAGIDFSIGRLVGGLAAELWSSLCNPGESLRRVRGAHAYPGTATPDSL